MISVVCVYNDKATLDSLLLASLARQDAAFDLTCLDNTSGQYACAATALNEAGRGAANDIVMFVHQDVEGGPDVLFTPGHPLVDPSE